MSDTLHSWLITLLGLPAPAWGAILACLAGATIPWIVEANVPMADWSGWKFRLATYGAATLAGMLTAVTVWHSWSALAMWVPALAINFARDIASHFLPWLSPRAQAVKQGEDGSVGYHVPGVDGTVWTRPDATQPKREDKQ